MAQEVAGNVADPSALGGSALPAMTTTSAQAWSELVMKSWGQSEPHHVVQSTEGTGRTLGLVTLGVIREFVTGPANALLRPKSQRF